MLKNLQPKKIKIYLIIFFSFFSQIIISGQLVQKPVTIFIHGTLLPVLSILNLYKTYTQTLTASDWYTQCLTKIRENPILHEDSIILEVGLKKIPQEILEKYEKKILPNNLSKIAAYQAIGAYNSLHNFVSDKKIETDYYTFGFLGLLSDKHRKEAAAELYKELISLIEQYKKENYDAQITLVGFSHGGNVILYLGAIEAKEKKNLSISNTILFASPIYEQAAIYAKENMFKKIVNLYSDGDQVQNRDTFSTPNFKSYRTLSNFINSENLKESLLKDEQKAIYDIRLRAHNNPKAFGHLCFWSFNKYKSTIFDHKDKYTQNVIDSLNPLPLVTLTPVILQMLNRINNTGIKKYDLALTTSNNSFLLKLFQSDIHSLRAISPNINSVLQKAQDYALNSWKTNARTSEYLLLSIGILAAFKTFTN